MSDSHDHSHNHGHAHDHGHSHDHEHSHDHGGDCSHCDHSAEPKLTKPDDVKDVPLPEWKKKALATTGTAAASDAAPFGGSWTTEAVVAATAEASEPSGDTTSHTHDDHSHNHSHGHSHDHMDDPGSYDDRPTSRSKRAKFSNRNFLERAFTVGIGGPVGSGKTALMLALCKKLRETYNIAAVTNDIFTREDGEFLTKHEALAKERIIAVETGGCPHAAIREDISANLQACEELTRKKFGGRPLDLILLESGGDNLAANYSPELADYTVYVIDVAGGDKVPRKGGPGVTQSDLLVINKTDLADAVGSSLEVMKTDAKRMRGEGPTVFAQAKQGKEEGVEEIAHFILDSWREATGGHLM